MTNLNDPVVLLSNMKQERGNFLHQRLIGIDYEYDDVGGTVTNRTPKSSLVKRVIAEDGPETSNQRHVVFAFESSPAIESISVQWPSGKTELTTPAAIDVEFVVIQGMTDRENHGVLTASF